MAGNYYTGTIQKGSTDLEGIKKWQTYLNTQGYNLKVDGDFGGLTEAATKEWQKNNGLLDDGIVGKLTWGKAGFKNINQATSAPEMKDLPTDLVQDTTLFNSTTEGNTLLGHRNTAYSDLTGLNPFEFSKQDDITGDNGILKQIENYGDFSYDVNADALYQQYKDKYIQQGKMAMADTMGQAAAMTGGYGNSYAAAAGQQAYQANLEKLNDVIPELYQQALERYKMGKDDLYDKYSLLMNEYDREFGEHQYKYNKYLDAYNIANDAYYNTADMYYSAQSNANAAEMNRFNSDMSKWSAENEQQWNEVQWAEENRRYELEQAAKASEGTVNDGTKDKEKDKEPPLVKDTKDDYADWDAMDWQSYFANIRSSEGQAAAESELNRMSRAGLIPKNLISAAASGARGGKLGH